MVLGSSPCGDHVIHYCKLNWDKRKHKHVLIAVFTEPKSSDYYKAAVSECNSNIIIVIVTEKISILRKDPPAPALHQNWGTWHLYKVGDCFNVQGLWIYKSLKILNARKKARCLIHVMQLKWNAKNFLSFPLVNFLLQLKSRVYCLNCFDELDKNSENVARIVEYVCVVFCSQFFCVK